MGFCMAGCVNLAKRFGDCYRLILIRLTSRVDGIRILGTCSFLAGVGIFIRMVINCSALPAIAVAR